MDFGKVLIGFIGYGFSVLMVLGFVCCLVDVGRAKRGNASGGTAEQNAHWAVSALITAFGVAIATRVILGLF